MVSESASETKNTGRRQNKKQSSPPEKYEGKMGGGEAGEKRKIGLVEEIGWTTEKLWKIQQKDEEGNSKGWRTEGEGKKTPKKRASGTDGARDRSTPKKGQKREGEDKEMARTATLKTRQVIIFGKGRKSIPHTYE